MNLSLGEKAPLGYYSMGPRAPNYASAGGAGLST